MSEKRMPKVIIADDEDHIRSLIGMMMKTMKTEVVAEAKRGDIVLELYRKEKPDLLLLDVNMPGKSGVEVLQEIKSEFPDAFIIMLTSMADRGTVERCIALGAAHYILKDTPVPEMRKIIKTAWDTSKKQRGRLDG